MAETEFTRKYVKDGLGAQREIEVTEAALIADASAPTPYSVEASGAVAVTSNAATDLDTTMAALLVLENETTTLTTKFNSLLAACRAAGIVAV